MTSTNQPDDVCRRLSFLRQELWVVHHLLQEADDPELQLRVELKVLRGDSRAVTGARGPREAAETNGTIRTCGCLDTQ